MNKISEFVKRERKKANGARENGIVQRMKRNSRDIEIQSVSQSKEISKSNNDSLGSW